MITNQSYGTVNVSCRTNIGKYRHANEDGYVITSIPFYEGQVAEDDVPEEGILLVVADGGGGSEAGRLACTLIHDYLLQELKAEWRGENSIEALRIAIERSNSHLHKGALENQSRNYFASITAVFIEGEVATIAQVGDTRAYLLRNKQFLQVTIDQTLVEQLLRHGISTKEQEKDPAYSNVVLQVLGSMPDIQIAFTEIHLKQLDRLLLCSDGLWWRVSDNEIKETLSSNFKIDEACQKLIDSALKKGGEDDITSIVVEASGKDLPERVELESPNQMFTILTRLEDLPGLDEWRLRKEKEQ
jgi:serine/threonine protein phosphatase PrpC